MTNRKPKITAQETTAARKQRLAARQAQMRERVAWRKIHVRIYTKNPAPAQNKFSGGTHDPSNSH
jgi:hypothetical protein